MSKKIEVLLAGRHQQNPCHDQPDEARSMVLLRVIIEIDDGYVCPPFRIPAKSDFKRELRWDTQNLK
jgi:hypothetical protein